MDRVEAKGEPIIWGRKAYYWGRKTKFHQGPRGSVPGCHTGLSVSSQARCRPAVGRSVGRRSSVGQTMNDPEVYESGGCSQNDGVSVSSDGVTAVVALYSIY